MSLWRLIKICAFWDVFRDLIILDWLFGGHRSHHDDDSIIPPLGGGCDYSSDGYMDHDDFLDEQDDYDYMDGYDSPGDYFDD